MKNTLTEFYGQQSGEKILFATRAHQMKQVISLIWLYLASGIIFLSGFIISSQISQIASITLLISSGIAIFLGVVGTLSVSNMNKKSISYVTDRRIVRFYAHTPFATSSRSLTWDQAVKVKTFPQNALLKMFKIGSVVVHATSTIAAADDNLSYNTVSDDDMHLNNIYYYKDLGNYIEKIIFIFKNDVKNLSSVKPFVLKPKGKRY